MSYVGKNRLHRQMLLGRALRTRGFGDDAIDPNIEMDCEDEKIWRSDPTCQELHPGLFPASPTAGAGGAAPSSGAASDLLASIKSGVSSITSGITSGLEKIAGGAGTAAGTAATASASKSGSDLGTLALVGAGAVGLYYLLKKKR
jgi:hypothetical protein